MHDENFHLVIGIQELPNIRKDELSKGEGQRDRDIERQREREREKDRQTNRERGREKKRREEIPNLRLRIPLIPHSEFSASR